MLKIYTGMQTPCKYSPCEYFCLSKGVDEIECICPDEMTYNIEAQKCVCEESFPSCRGSYLK